MLNFRPFLIEIIRIYDLLGLHACLHKNNFAFCDLNMPNFRPYFSLNVVYNDFEGLYVHLPEKNMHFW